MSSSKLSVLLVGPMGHGKSSFGNKILKRNVFTTGSSAGRVTEYVNIKQNNGYIVADCAGFGDVKDDKVFTNSYKTMKPHLLRIAPLDAILFIVKFNNEESVSFYNAAKEFWEYFGTSALKSTIFVCIQCGNLKYADDEFEKILKKHPAYRFFKAKAEKDIPFVLWDNLIEYYGQNEDLENAIRNLDTKFTYELFNIMFDVFERFNL